MRSRHSTQYRETNAPRVGKGFQRPMIIYGVNPTAEALRAGTVAKIWVRNGANRRVEQIVILARRAGITVCRLETPELNRLVSGEAHQGIVAELETSRLKIGLPSAGFCRNEFSINHVHDYPVEIG